MKPYEKPLSPQEYLMHYGVKGMKWGVRRYQNYDGSYTRKGLERYRKAESDYETAKSKADETRAAYKSGQATRQQVKDAKSAVKTEKRKMENAYEKLKTDKLADEGKKLYQSGKTISIKSSIVKLQELIFYKDSTQGCLIGNDNSRVEGEEFIIQECDYADICNQKMIGYGQV